MIYRVFINIYTSPFTFIFFINWNYAKTWIFSIKVILPKTFYRCLCYCKRLSYIFTFFINLITFFSNAVGNVESFKYIYKLFYNVYIKISF